MSNIVTPEELLNSQVEEFNKGNISFLMTLYEKTHVLPMSQERLSRIWKVYAELYRVSLIWELS
jgi:hypothetical protein